MNTMVLVRTTVAEEGQARALARRLAGKTACCVHLQRIESVYPWEGALEESHEWLVEARTPAPLKDALWDAMLDGHPYDVPMVEVVGETLVPSKYAAWARDVTG